MWLLITLWVLCCTVAVVLCVSVFFFLSFHRGFCFAEPAEVYQDKRCTTFFRITSQARSVPFFLSSFSLYPSPLPSSCECVNVLIFLSSSFFFVCCCCWCVSETITFFLLLALFRLFTKAFRFCVRVSVSMDMGVCLCAEYACISITKDRVGVYRSWTVFVRLLLSFHLPSFCADAFFASASMA